MVTFNMMALSLFFRLWVFVLYYICIFSSFHFRKQSCQFKREKKKQQTTQCNVSLTNTNAQARCLAEPQSEKAVKASDFLQTGLIT